MRLICCFCCQVTSVASNSVRPHRRQPTRLPRPWDSPGKNTGVGCISFSNAWKWKVKVKSLSHVQLFSTPWTAAYQAPPPMGFSRQEYWSGVPLPSPETDLLISKSSLAWMFMINNTLIHFFMYSTIFYWACATHRKLSFFHKTTSLRGTLK